MTSVRRDQKKNENSLREHTDDDFDKSPNCALDRANSARDEKTDSTMTEQVQSQAKHDNRVIASSGHDAVVPAEMSKPLKNTTEQGQRNKDDAAANDQSRGLVPDHICLQCDIATPAQVNTFFRGHGNLDAWDTETSALPLIWYERLVCPTPRLFYTRQPEVNEFIDIVSKMPDFYPRPFRVKPPIWPVLHRVNTPEKFDVLMQVVQQTKSVLFLTIFEDDTKFGSPPRLIAIRIYNDLYIVDLAKMYIHAISARGLWRRVRVPVVVQSGAILDQIFRFLGWEFFHGLTLQRYLDAEGSIDFRLSQTTDVLSESELRRVEHLARYLQEEGPFWTKSELVIAMHSFYETGDAKALIYRLVWKHDLVHFLYNASLDGKFSVEPVIKEPISPVAIACASHHSRERWLSVQEYRFKTAALFGVHETKVFSDDVMVRYSAGVAIENLNGSALPTTQQRYILIALNNTVNFEQVQCGTCLMIGHSRQYCHNRNMFYNIDHRLFAADITAARQCFQDHPDHLANAIVQHSEPREVMGIEYSDCSASKMKVDMIFTLYMSDEPRPKCPPFRHSLAQILLRLAPFKGIRFNLNILTASGIPSSLDSRRPHLQGRLKTCCKHHWSLLGLSTTRATTFTIRYGDIVHLAVAKH